MSKVADRRTSIRIEILGRLPGTITAQRSAVLHNISAGGALIETAWPIPQDSVLVVSLESPTHLAAVEARVCRVRPDHGNVYMVGLEFTTDGAADELARLIPQSIPDDAQ
jgi:PilZ domain